MRASIQLDKWQKKGALPSSAAALVIALVTSRPQIRFLDPTIATNLR